MDIRNSLSKLAIAIQAGDWESLRKALLPLTIAIQSDDREGTLGEIDYLIDSLDARAEHDELVWSAILAQDGRALARALGLD